MLTPVQWTMIRNSLELLADETYQLAASKGFHDQPRAFGELLMLVCSELSEALEHYRVGKGYNEVWIEGNGKPDGIPIELADALIRILALCGHYDIDIGQAVLNKHVFNQSRPYRHGGKLA